MAKLQNKTRGSTYSNIPTQREKTNPTEPEWVTKIEQWGTAQEIRQLGNEYKKALNFSKKSADATKKLISQRDAADFSRSYKHGDKQKDTPRYRLKGFNIPANQS